MSVVDGWGMTVVDRVFEDYLLLVDKEEEGGDHDLFDVAVVEVVELLVHPPEVIFLLFLVVEEHRFLHFTFKTSVIGVVVFWPTKRRFVGNKSTTSASSWWMMG